MKNYYKNPVVFSEIQAEIKAIIENPAEKLAYHRQLLSQLNTCFVKIIHKEITLQLEEDKKTHTLQLDDYLANITLSVLYFQVALSNTSESDNTNSDLKNLAVYHFNQGVLVYTRNLNYAKQVRLLSQNLLQDELRFSDDDTYQYAAEFQTLLTSPKENYQTPFSLDWHSLIVKAHILFSKIIEIDERKFKMLRNYRSRVALFISSVISPDEANLFDQKILIDQLDFLDDLRNQNKLIVANLDDNWNFTLCILSRIISQPFEDRTKRLGYANRLSNFMRCTDPESFHYSYAEIYHALNNCYIDLKENTLLTENLNEGIETFTALNNFAMKNLLQIMLLIHLSNQIKINKSNVYYTRCHQILMTALASTKDCFNGFHHGTFEILTSYSLFEKIFRRFKLLSQEAMTLPGVNANLTNLSVKVYETAETVFSANYQNIALDRLNHLHENLRKSHQTSQFYIKHYEPLEQWLEVLRLILLFLKKADVLCKQVAAKSRTTLLNSDKQFLQLIISHPLLNSLVKSPSEGLNAITVIEKLISEAELDIQNTKQTRLQNLSSAFFNRGKTSTNIKRADHVVQAVHPFTFLPKIGAGTAITAEIKRDSTSVIPDAKKIKLSASFQ